MITIRRAGERGHFDFGWLDTWHTFSFGDYHDPRYMGFRGLRVINEDRVQPAKGFPTHALRDMEIVTYILAGALEHKDSLGTGSVIRPGEVQRMSAGTGVTHSEYNPSTTEAVHLLQIWILPERASLPPSYEQKGWEDRQLLDQLRLLGSHDGREGSVMIHADVCLYGARWARGVTLAHELAPGRHAWVQVARGAVGVNDQRLGAGDGAAISDERTLRLAGAPGAEVLLFDLA
jgi:redox-sensitive bicupin YhaK (pirin superfamily)